ncbi:hypothetical protein HG535_0H02600 [Zygotorulaspora mrakii]|uniref:tRNA-splicing endonuclease subunit Sen54 N-terminal domain-containing protein n=1 Tax=Zygotorulaspora mrakii TaxID=42260 RepID=A0A7H9B8T3_ZYGMR|nr:uncharacterized protein HG535_0H02600 [Zygotorulaspora mrakii]QLG74933.1 hypothetical protein HG535_0H02600 [Zygotorulaspora mrakii]
MSSVDEDSKQQVLIETPVDSEAEDDDVIQDWSDAAKLSKKTTQTSLPKRGEKDYEPDGTDVQDLLLYRARKAMFDTLYNAARGTTLNNQVKAYYVPAFSEAVIPQPKGNFLQTIGKSDSNGKCWLQLHEFVYLAERGTIAPYYCKSFPIISGTENQDFEIPLSMQDLYSFFKSQHEMDRYFVYAHLKRLGFIVKLTEDHSTDYTTFFAPSGDSKVKRKLRLAFRSVLNFWNKQKCLALNTFFYGSWNFLIRKFTSTPQIYLGLSKLIPTCTPPKTIKDLHRERFLASKKDTVPHLELVFDLWKPQTNFKKKSPGLPDFQVVIHNKNDANQHFPTYSDFRELFHSLDYKFDFLSEIDDDISWNDHCYTNGVLRSEYLSSLKSKAVQMKSSIHNKMLRSKRGKPIKSCSPAALQTKRLKSGYRSFLVAVMDGGLISFVKISEADFGSENVWYVPSSSLKRNKGRNRKVSQR